MFFPADESFEIGRKAYNEGDYYHCILWMSEAWKILDTEANPSTDKAVLLDYLSFAMYSVSTTSYYNIISQLFDYTV